MDDTTQDPLITHDLLREHPQVRVLLQGRHLLQGLQMEHHQVHDLLLVLRHLLDLQQGHHLVLDHQQVQRPLHVRLLHLVHDHQQVQCHLVDQRQVLHSLQGHQHHLLCVQAPVVLDQWVEQLEVEAEVDDDNFITYV